MRIDEDIGAYIFEEPVGARVWEPVGIGAIVMEPPNPIGEDGYGPGDDIGYGGFPFAGRYGAGTVRPGRKQGTGAAGSGFDFGAFLNNVAGGFLSAYQMREQRKMMQSAYAAQQQPPQWMRAPMWQPPPYAPPRAGPAINPNTLLIAGAAGIAALAILK